VKWCIIIDVVLGWLTLFGLHIVIGPLNSITRPLYDFVRKILPTTVGMLDLAPLILFFAINVLIGIGIPAIAQLIK
jgi:YggT family protein